MDNALSATLNLSLKGLERARRPKLRGVLRPTGLAAAVEVLRDRWGVPHIYAANATDLVFAQGFIHAQDRLWQMEFQRRLVAGRLAEVVGPAALSADRAVRILGMRRVVEADLALLDTEARAELDAYVKGVNACMAVEQDDGVEPIGQLGERASARGADRATGAGRGLGAGTVPAHELADGDIIGRAEFFRAVGRAN